MNNWANLSFETAAEAYLARRRPLVAARTLQLDRERLVPLRRAFAGRVLALLTPEELVVYQQARRAQVSNRTVNLEMGVVRRMLKRARLWSLDFAEDVYNLPEHSVIARVLTPEEKGLLFWTAASKPCWETAFLAARIACLTTCRLVELRYLRWENVDFARAVLAIRRSKGRTAGVRVIPLNAEALTVFRRLRDRAEQQGLYRPEFYVFPRRDPQTRRLIASQPQASWRSAWRSLTRAAGLGGLRFHDLRHQVVTELYEQGVSPAVLMALAGHSSRAMLDAYTHIRMPAMREAVGKLTCGLITGNLRAGGRRIGRGRGRAPGDRGPESPARPVRRPGS